ncbi:acyl-CoA dehydrogenase family protein [Rhodovibrionaceae bacterium A322]
MDFSLNDDRRMLQDTLTRFLRDSYDFETRQKASGSDEGYSADLWKQFADLGVIGALLPEEAGGFGGEGEDLMVVMQQLGRHLVVEPFVSTAVISGSLLTACGTDEQKALLEQVIAGDLLLAFAHGEPDSRYDLNSVSTTATKTDQGWILQGRKAVVLGGDQADKIIVSARTAGESDEEQGISLFIIDALTTGVSRRGYPTIDGWRAADIELDGVVVPQTALLGTEGEAYQAIEEATARGIMALCAEAVGVMETARDLTLEYLQTRQQFGQPLGKFQALQHRMAELLIEIEQARSITQRAAGYLGEDRLLREQTVSAAKNLIGRVGRLVSEESIQLHGGIAMTWEYALPHYAKRLTMIDHQLGDTDHHLERYMALGRGAA